MQFNSVIPFLINERNNSNINLIRLEHNDTEYNNRIIELLAILIWLISILVLNNHLGVTIDYQMLVLFSMDIIFIYIMYAL